MMDPYQQIIDDVQAVEREATAAQTPTPAPAATPDPAAPVEPVEQWYTPVYGDTAHSIAAAYGLDVARLVELNAGNLVDVDNLTIGLPLRVA